MSTGSRASGDRWPVAAPAAVVAIHLVALLVLPSEPSPLALAGVEAVALVALLAGSVRGRRSLRDALSTGGVAVGLLAGVAWGLTVAEPWVVAVALVTACVLAGVALARLPTAGGVWS